MAIWKNHSGFGSSLLLGWLSDAEGFCGREISQQFAGIIQISNSTQEVISLWVSELLSPTLFRSAIRRDIKPNQRKTRTRICSDSNSWGDLLPVRTRVYGYIMSWGINEPRRWIWDKQKANQQVECKGVPLNKPDIMYMTQVVSPGIEKGYRQQQQAIELIHRDSGSQRKNQVNHRMVLTESDLDSWSLFITTTTHHHPVSKPDFVPGWSPAELTDGRFRSMERVELLIVVSLWGNAKWADCQTTMSPPPLSSHICPNQSLWLPSFFILHMFPPLPLSPLAMNIFLGISFYFCDNAPTIFMEWRGIPFFLRWGNVNTIPQ